MTTSSYRVVVDPEAQDDVKDLPTDALKREAMRLMLALRDDPYLGEELRARPNIKVIGQCRKIPFDESNYRDRPRYRIVYCNEPEGAPQQITVLAVSSRAKLDAYRKAAARLSRSVRTRR